MWQKSVMLLVVDWATIRVEKARLHWLLSNSIKTSYFRNMAWLKLLPLGNDMTFGGWVSENCLALVRILPWVMLPVRSWEEVTEYRDPDGSPKDWTRSQLREFLRQRGIKVRGEKPPGCFGGNEEEAARPAENPLSW
jgi:hypothetical protein